MFLLFLGIILVLLSRTILRDNTQVARYQRSGFWVGLAFIAIGFLSKIFVVIDPGTVGVPTFFGSVQPYALESGLRIVNPLMSITEFNVRTQNYTMSATHNEGQKSGDDAIRVLTADGLEVTMDLSVLYHVNSTETPRIISTIGSDFENVIVRPITRTRIRDNAVYYDAVALFSSKRDEFQTRIYQSIEKDFKESGLILEKILIRNIALPESVKTTIEGKISAEQEAQKMQFVLQKEKQEAERKRVEAQGIADYQRIISTGLGDKQLQYEQIKAMKELANSNNAKIVIMNGKGAPLLLNQ
jgi:regulator of protease activity HflC (stomatin/prohibitin superfamily)